MLVLKKFQLTNPTIKRFGALERMSVSRFLSDSFWGCIDYNYLREILSSNLRVVDVGCGSGKYRNILKLSDNDTYLGVDISHSSFWSEPVEDRVSFRQTSYLNVNEYLPNINLLITQSAIEHFEYDLLFFREIQKHVKESGQPLIQIHLFPAKAGLWTGLLHGIRQYNLRMVRRIVRASKLEIPGILVTLGGPKSNRFHWDTITKFQLSHNYDKVFTSKLKNLLYINNYFIVTICLLCDDPLE
jgi:SAM-dependent methyltransferase